MSGGPVSEVGVIVVDPLRTVGRWAAATAARSIAGDAGQARMAAEVPMEDLRYKMIMALNAADIGNPICEQAAEICAEIAEQYCAELHVTTTTTTTTAPVIAAGQQAANGPAPARA